ncbi:hypothetical protein KC217_22765, partial [Mycobacterium tuberculosis]|nr:hypothetical protein [Mycobacterium tuberculosis]
DHGREQAVGDVKGLWSVQVGRGADGVHLARHMAGGRVARGTNGTAARRDGTATPIATISPTMAA